LSSHGAWVFVQGCCQCLLLTVLDTMSIELQNSNWPDKLFANTQKSPERQSCFTASTLDCCDLFNTRTAECKILSRGSSHGKVLPRAVHEDIGVNPHPRHGGAGESFSCLCTCPPDQDHDKSSAISPTSNTQTLTNSTEQQSERQHFSC
jgi:hypothetical protein